MSKLFLALSFKDVADIFEKFAGTAEGKTVTFIPTASAVEKVNFFVKSGKKALEKMGLIVDELEISAAGIDEIREKLTANDFIYISGGNTFYLLQELRKSGAGEIIRQQVELGKIYIGESAGSMVAAPNIAFAQGMDSVKKASELVSMEGLGLADFYVVPHYTNAPFKKAAEKIIAEYGEKLTLHPISNKQAILVDDGVMRIETL